MGRAHADPKLRCFGTGDCSRLSFIHGYSGGYGGGSAARQVRQVELGAIGCPATDLSAPHFTLTGGPGCTATVTAVLDFGNFGGNGDPRPLSAACATVNGFSWNAGGPDPSRGLLERDRHPSVRLRTTKRHPEWTVGNRARGIRRAATATSPRFLQLHQDRGRLRRERRLGASRVPQPGGRQGCRIRTRSRPTIPSDPYYEYTVTVGLSKPLANSNWDDDPDPAPRFDRTEPVSDVGLQTPGNNLRDWFTDGCANPYSLNYDDHDAPTTGQGVAGHHMRHGAADAASGLRVDVSGWSLDSSVHGVRRAM